MPEASLSVLGREAEKIAILSSLCKKVPMVLHGVCGIGKTSLPSFAAHISCAMDTESVFLVCFCAQQAHGRTRCPR
jgi:hypothetical protein